MSWLTSRPIARIGVLSQCAVDQGCSLSSRRRQLPLRGAHTYKRLTWGDHDEGGERLVAVKVCMRGEKVASPRPPRKTRYANVLILISFPDPP